MTCPRSFKCAVDDGVLNHASGLNFSPLTLSTPFALWHFSFPIKRHRYFPISCLWIHLHDLVLGRSNDAPIPILGFKGSCVLLSWAPAITVRKGTGQSNGSRVKTCIGMLGLDVGPRGETWAELPQLKSPADPQTHVQAYPRSADSNQSTDVRTTIILF